MDLIYSTINIYDRLKLKYKEYLKTEIVSIVIMQTKDEVFIETMEAEITDNGLEKQTFKRVNLDFISDGTEDRAYFDSKAAIESNAQKFIEEFTPYSIINTTDLFRKEACQKISAKYNTFRIDK